MGARWLTVHARLVELLPTLPGWSGIPTFPGPTVTASNPRTYVTVGYAQLEESAGTYTREPGTGDLGVEIGSVRCELVSAHGSADLKVPQARAFALLDSLEDYLRADPTLGGTLMAGTTTVLTVDVLPAQTTEGAEQRLAFSVDYATPVWP